WGERTGMRYRPTDKVQVPVARVDLEARRSELRLATGISYDPLMRIAMSEPDKRRKPWSEAPEHTSAGKPAALKGLPAKARRAAASKSTRQAKEARKSRKAAKRV